MKPGIFPILRRTEDALLHDFKVLTISLGFLHDGC